MALIPIYLRMGFMDFFANNVIIVHIGHIYQQGRVGYLQTELPIGK